MRSQWPRRGRLRTGRFRRHSAKADLSKQFMIALTNHSHLPLRKLASWLDGESARALSKPPGAGAPSRGTRLSVRREQGTATERRHRWGPSRCMELHVMCRQDLAQGHRRPVSFGVQIFSANGLSPCHYAIGRAWPPFSVNVGDRDGPTAQYGATIRLGLLDTPVALILSGGD